MADALLRLEKAKSRTDCLCDFLLSAEWEIAGLSRSDRARIAARLKQCSCWIVFREYMKFSGGDLDVNDIRLAAMLHCQKDKLCMSCAGLRAGRLSMHFSELSRALIDATGYKPAHYTFTIRNTENLADVLGRLVSAVRGLIKHRSRYEFWLSTNRAGRVREYTEWIHIHGGVFTVEIKRGKGSNLWHPHIHMLALIRADLDPKRFRAEWTEATGGEGLGLDMAYVKDAHTSHGAFREVFKYVCKFNEMNFDDNLHAYCVTRNMRLRDSFGCYRGLKLDDKQLTDDLRNDGSSFRDILFVWDRESETYQARSYRYGESLPSGADPVYRQYHRAAGELTVSLSDQDWEFHINSLDDEERLSDSATQGASGDVPF